MQKLLKRIITKYLKKDEKKNNKGFTLVELVYRGRSFCHGHRPLPEGAPFATFYLSQIRLPLL